MVKLFWCLFDFGPLFQAAGRIFPFTVSLVDQKDKLKLFEALKRWKAWRGECSLCSAGSHYGHCLLRHFISAHQTIADHCSFSADIIACNGDDIDLNHLFWPTLLNSSPSIMGSLLDTYWQIDPGLFVWLFKFKNEMEVVSMATLPLLTPCWTSPCLLLWNLHDTWILLQILVEKQDWYPSGMALGWYVG